MAEHIATDELAELAAGLVDDGRQRSIDAHLAGCAICAERQAALVAVGQALSAAPPLPMPPDVVARLDQVLAAEQARRVIATPLLPVARPSLGHWDPAQPGSRASWRVVRGALAAAVAAIVVGFGGFALSAGAGLNEPTAAPRVELSSGDLATAAVAVAQSRDVDVHLFSRAWRCANEVTTGRITGLVPVTVDGKPALLAYTRSGGARFATVVTGCNRSAPTAEATTPLAR